jgi:hypothetical protein
VSINVNQTPTPPNPVLRMTMRNARSWLAACVFRLPMRRWWTTWLVLEKHQKSNVDCCSMSKACTAILLCHMRLVGQTNYQGLAMGWPAAQTVSCGAAGQTSFGSIHFPRNFLANDKTILIHPLSTTTPSAPLCTVPDQGTSSRSCPFCMPT